MQIKIVVVVLRAVYKTVMFLTLTNIVDVGSFLAISK